MRPRDDSYDGHGDDVALEPALDLLVEREDVRARG